MVLFPSNALLWSLSSETTWVVRASPGALGWKHVICGCCRVTSQKAFLSSVGVHSLFFDVVPSILRLRIDGWFSRCRGKLRAQLQMFKRESHESQAPRVKPSSRERRERHAMFQRESREICNWRVVFQQSNLPLPTGGLSNPIVRMGEPRPCPGLLGGPTVL